MGGNALSTKSVRLADGHYRYLARECVASLRQQFPGGKVAAIESYRGKPTHGDLDILIAAPNFDPLVAAVVLDAVEVVRNGPVTSVGVQVHAGAPLHEGNVFQVDLVTVDESAFEYALNYFAFNDLGNLIGRTAHAAGLSHKHTGLWFYVRDGDYKFREILLTQDYDRALEFLGYDVERFRAGFETLEDIFWFVADSAFFNRDIYLLENRNAVARTRDRKRRTYSEFLSFCQVHPELPSFKYPPNKSDWLSRIKEFFPFFEVEYNKALADLARLRKAKATFNGEWVAGLTGLHGKALGAVMREFKNSFQSAEEQRDFVLNNSQEVIAERVMQGYHRLAALVEREGGSAIPLTLTSSPP